MQKLEKICRHHQKEGPKGAVSRQSSSLCLILPITRPRSLWNLKLKQRNYMEMTKSEFRDKQICLLSIIFEVANSRDQLWKTVRLNSFQKPFLFQFVSIFFSFAHPWHLLYILCYFNLFFSLASFNVLISDYFYVSLNLTGI